MVKNNFYIWLFVVVLIFSCSRKHKVKEYNITPILKAETIKANDGDTVKVNLYNEIPFDWEYILILPPYTDNNTIKEKHLINYSAIEAKILELSINDGICLLLYIKNKEIVKYSTVLRNPLDFSVIIKGKNKMAKISKNIDSGRLYIKKSGNKLAFLN